MQETTKMNDISRKEYPNPQFERKNWTNLNGEWEFEIDCIEFSAEKQKQKQSKFNYGTFCPKCNIDLPEGLVDLPVSFNLTKNELYH